MKDKDRTETFHVTSELAGIRADIALSRVLEGQTRSQVKRLIEEGNVVIEGEPIKSSRKLEQGEEVRVRIPPPESLEAEPEEIPLSVLYEDEDLIVIDKPAGMTVHPGAGVKQGTLVNALLFRCKDLSGIGGKIRPGIVHRLDKNTSGVMVVAKNDMSHDSLVRQFKDRTVKKTYLAIVEGTVKKDSGSFSSKIGRHPTHRVKMSSKATSGRESLTNWKVLKRFEKAALVVAEPKTGRTHQIRVHFSENGHPILADELYGPKKHRTTKLDRAAKVIGRQALHASGLGFTHPHTGKFMEFTAPVPQDMKKALNILEESGENY
jgi:23S rRNA pseudouridine1911/1915/1917 synthase